MRLYMCVAMGPRALLPFSSEVWASFVSVSGPSKSLDVGPKDRFVVLSSSSGSCIFLSESLR